MYVRQSPPLPASTSYTVSGSYAVSASYTVSASYVMSTIYDKYYHIAVTYPMAYVIRIILRSLLARRLFLLSDYTRFMIKCYSSA